MRHCVLLHSKMHSYFYCLVTLGQNQISQCFWPIMQDEIFEMIIILAFFMAL